MQFLYPGFLWALGAIAIPIIIHFFNFHRYKTVYFSNVRFLQQIRRESRSQSNLRNWLLLFLRIMAIVFLVLVFARPFIPEKSNAIRHKAQNRVSVYIDNSFSMEAQGKYGTLIEWAKMRARELTDAFPPSTEYLLLTNELNPIEQRWVNRDQFINWVSKIQTTHIVLNIEEVIQRQQLIMSDTSYELSSFLLSDFQRSTFQLKNVKPIKGQRIFIMPLQAAVQQNISIDSVWFTSPGLYPGKVEEMKVRIKNHGNSSVNESVLQFFLNDSLKSSVTFSIEPKSSTEVQCTFTQGKVGINQGRVEIADYPIVFDNQLYFSYNINPVVQVYGIGDDKINDYLTALFYNDKAVEYQLINTLQVRYDNLNKSQLVIVNQVDKLSSGLTEELIGFVMQGGQLALIPAANQNPLAFDPILKATHGPKIGEWIYQEGVFTQLDRKHPLFANAIAHDAQNPTLPNYSGFYRLQTNQRQMADIIFKNEPGDPLFMEYPFGNGKIFVSALPFNDRYTNLLTHPLFVPLFYNMALQSTVYQQLYYPVVQNMVVSTIIPAGGSAVYSIKNLRNNNQLFPVYRKSNNRIFLYPDANALIAGHWQVLANDQLQAITSFNYNHIESDLECLNPDEVAKQFKDKGFEQVFLTDAADKMVSRNIEKQQRGTDLWQIFLIMALSMLLVEMFVLRMYK